MSIQSLNCHDRSGIVNAMALTSDGENIVVGGQFIMADAVTTKAVALWNFDTMSWQDPLGEGIEDGGWINAIAIYGSYIYVGGTFYISIGTSEVVMHAYNVARFDLDSVRPACGNTVLITP